MVEWKKLSDVAVIKNGKDYKKLSNGTIPVYGTGGIMTYVDQFASDKPSVLLPRKGSVENIFYVDKPFWTVDTLYWTDIDTSRIDPKFLFMSLQRYNLKEYAYGGARPSLSQSILYNLDIPLPSLSEQQRIVEQLDTFTSSIENLKEQIAQRRKQYEYYRDQLLDLEGKEGVEMKKLKELSLVITDGDHMPPPKTNTGIPFITISNINKDSNDIDFRDTFYVPKEYYNQLKEEKKPVKGDVLYTVTGSYGIPVYLKTNRDFCFQRHIGLIRIDSNLCLPKYCYYWLGSRSAKKQAEGCASGGAQKTVSLNSLRNFILPIISLSEQQRIVSILDTFEASIRNLEQQLAQREKQYEFYRNKLLTFE